MSVFGSIVSAIFGSKHGANVAPPPEDLRHHLHLRALRHLRGRHQQPALLPVHRPSPLFQERTLKRSSRNFTTNNAKTSIGGNRSSI